MHPKRAIYTSLGWAALGNMGVNAGRLLLLLLLSRVMPGSEFGVLAIVHTLFSFSTFFVDGGIGNVLFRAELPSRETRAALFWWSMGWGVGLLALILIVSNWLSAFYNMPRLQVALPLAALGLVFTAAGAQHRVLLRRALRFDLLAKIELAAFAVNFGLTLCLTYRGYGCLAVIWGNLANLVVVTLLYFIVGDPEWRPRWYFRRHLVRPYTTFGFYQMGERCANYLAERSDVLIIGKVLGAEALGLYDVMKQLLSRPEAVFNAVAGSVALPVMAARAEDAGFLQKAYMGLVQRLNVLNFPIFVFCMAFPTPLLLATLGANWSAQAAVFQCLAAYQLLHSTCNPVGALQMAKGRADLGFYWNLLLLMLMPAAVFLGLHWGLLGTAMAIFVLFFGLQPFFYRYMVWAVVPIDWKPYYFSWLLPLLAALVAACLAHTVLLPFGDNLGIFILAGGVYAVVYTALIFVFNRKIFEIKYF